MKPFPNGRGCFVSLTWTAAPGQSRRAVVMHRFAEFVAPSRLGRSFRWLLASSWVTNLGEGSRWRPARCWWRRRRTIRWWWPWPRSCCGCLAVARLVCRRGRRPAQPARHRHHHGAGAGGDPAASDGVDPDAPRRHRGGSGRAVPVRGGRDLRRHHDHHLAADARRQARPGYRELTCHDGPGRVESAGRPAGRRRAVRGRDGAAVRQRERVRARRRAADRAGAATGARRARAPRPGAR